MSDPFDSSRRKLAWAKKHLAQFKRKNIQFFKKKNLYAVFAEPSTKHPPCIVHKMRFVKQLPAGFSEMTGDIVDNLRAALDHAVYGVAIAAAPGTRPLNAYFPFSRDASKFEANLKGRCADVPKEIYPLLRSYEPYKGGSDALWAINQVCVANKHTLIIPIGTACATVGLRIEGTGFWTILDRFVVIVETILNEIEAEIRRLGFLP
jgi:hypothetical protein